MAAGITTGIPEYGAYVAGLVRRKARTNVSNDETGKALRALLVNHEFVSYCVPQGDFQWIAVNSTLRTREGWRGGSHLGSSMCFSYERRLPREELMQGYFASKDAGYVYAELIRLEADGWKILHKSWENSDKFS